MQTKDGYLLGLHRLAYKKGEEDTKVNRGPNSIKKRVVYLHHGLLMNSEVWVCLTDEQRCLPFVLVERGFDVWVRSSALTKAGKTTDKGSPFSSETTAATSTPRSPSTVRPCRKDSGTSRSTSSPSTISLTALATFWRPRGSRLCHTLVSPRVQPKLLLVCPSTRSSMTRSMSLSLLLQPCPRPAYPTALSTPSSRRHRRCYSCFSEDALF